MITIYNDCSCLVKPYFTALILYCLITLCLLYMHFKISAYNDHLVLFFKEKTCSYGLRASQFLELSVSEFWQLFPTHMLSLESVLRFCHGIDKGGDCKVEFNQPSCWLYSVPNLLVF